MKDKVVLNQRYFKDIFGSLGCLFVFGLFGLFFINPNTENTFIQALISISMFIFALSLLGVLAHIFTGRIWIVFYPHKIRVFYLLRIKRYPLDDLQEVQLRWNRKGTRGPSGTTSRVYPSLTFYFSKRVFELLPEQINGGGTTKEQKTILRNFINQLIDKQWVDESIVLDRFESFEKDPYYKKEIDKLLNDDQRKES